MSINTTAVARIKTIIAIKTIRPPGGEPAVLLLDDGGDDDEVQLIRWMDKRPNKLNQVGNASAAISGRGS